MGDDALCQHCTGGPSSKLGGLFSEASYSFSLRFAEKLGLFVFSLHLVRYASCKKGATVGNIKKLCNVTSRNNMIYHHCRHSCFPFDRCGWPQSAFGAALSFRIRLEKYIINNPTQAEYINTSRGTVPVRYNRLMCLPQRF